MRRRNCLLFSLNKLSFAPELVICQGLTLLPSCSESSAFPLRVNSYRHVCFSIPLARGKSSRCSECPSSLLLPKPGLGHWQEAGPTVPQGAQAPRPSSYKTHTLLSLPVLRPSSKALILWTLQQGPVETSGTPAGRGEVEAPSCHAAFLVDCLGGSCQNSKWKQPPTPFWGSDDSIPTHPG